jgi:DtxR family Mn-dependent transcriptional regulator
MIDDPSLRDLRSEAVEDFLKTVYKLQQTYDLVPTTVLAQALEITPPSATDMAKKLADSSRMETPLLSHERYRGVRLTPLGEQVALEVLRHHRLIELYLVKALGYSWDEVHEEADRLEHVISERFEAKIAEYLGDPDIDPHGDPIPSRDGAMPDRDKLIALADWPLNQEGIVGRLLDQSPEKLQYLAQKEIKPGTTVLVLEREPFDGLTHVLINDKAHVLSQSITQSVLITKGT